MSHVLSFREREVEPEKADSRVRRAAEIAAIDSGGNCGKCDFTKPHGLSLWCQKKAKLIQKYNICSQFAMRE